MIKRELTKNDLELSPNAYDTAAEYVNEYRIARGAEAVSQLPLGLQRVYLVLDLDGMYFNGGLAEYFASHMTDGGELDERVTLVAEALDAMEATALASLVRDAAESWRSLLAIERDENDESKPVPLLTSGHAPRDVSDQRMLDAMEVCDARFDEIYGDSASAIAGYIVRHSEDFCHVM